MKNLILMLVFLIVAIGANAQTSPTEVSTDATIKKATYDAVWGTTADTLTNADTLEFVYRVRGDESPDILIKLYSDHVSGTAGGTLTPYSSPDGVNYAALDTVITVTSLTEDGLDTETIQVNDYMYPYLKLIYLQTGTAVTIPKAYVYAKFN